MWAKDRRLPPEGCRSHTFWHAPRTSTPLDVLSLGDHSPHLARHFARAEMKKPSPGHPYNQWKLVGRPLQAGGTLLSLDPLEKKGLDFLT